MVFDVLRATTSIVTGLASGMERIVTAATLEEARAFRERHPDWLLAGERGGDPPEGFDLGNSPVEFTRQRGRSAVITTTNGTVALRACEGARRVFVGALVNFGATLEAVAAEGPQEVILVCAGTGPEFALEDGLVAGLFARALRDRFWKGALHTAHCCDATQALMLLADGLVGGWPQALRQARNARTLVAAGRAGDVEFALGMDRFVDAAVVCEDGVCRLWRRGA